MAQSGSNIAQATAGQNHADGNDVALSQARSQTSAAGAVVQQWLSQFGTARVQLGVNDRFDVDGSAADVHIQLYDSPSSMLFTQMGALSGRAHHAERGHGRPFFSGGWMYGVNTFIDNNVTGHNRRMGISG